ncbi:MAG: YceI family protein [Sciscionella sp.]
MTTTQDGVSAQIRGIDGWPVPDAVLTVTDSAGIQVARVTVDGSGLAVTESLPSGSYTAIVTAPGFQPQARTAVVTAAGASGLGVVALSREGNAVLPAPGVWTIDPIHSSINVSARHLGFASIRGRFADFGGRIEVAEPVEQSLVLAQIKAASIDTGNTMRDDHLRSADFLGVDQHPVIEYRGTHLTPVAAQRWTLHGELTLNAVTRSVPLDLTYDGAGPDAWGGVRAGFHAVVELQREDFAITYNQILQAGISAIGATLRVEMNIEAVQGDGLPQL